MAHGYNELELTEKGRRALEEESVEIDKQLPRGSQIPILAMLAMIKQGMSISDMVRDFMQIINNPAAVQEADSFLESLAHYIVNRGYARWLPDQDEEPPEAFGEFKDFF